MQVSILYICMRCVPLVLIEVGSLSLVRLVHFVICRHATRGQACPRSIRYRRYAPASELRASRSFERITKAPLVSAQLQSP